MKETVLSPLENLEKIEATPENEEKIRELICRILARNKTESAKSVCQRKLRALENEKLIRLTKADCSYFELSGFLRSICLCSDILLGHTGLRIVCDTEDISTAASPNIFAFGFLNLLSNAAKFSLDGQIEISLKEAEKQAVITVKNQGHFDFEKDGFKKGLAAAENAARLHKGSLFIGASSGCVTAAMSLSLFLIPKNKIEVPLFPELLTDEFSCVHIGLSDVFPSASDGEILV